MIPIALTLLAIRDFRCRSCGPTMEQDPMSELMTLSARSAEECHAALVHAVESGYAKIDHDYELTAAGRKLLHDHWRNFILTLQDSV